MPTRKRKILPKPKLSLEGVQLCELNAERLLRDSTTVSEPTASALCELSIEEASKGLMMVFLMEDDPESEGDIKLEPSELASIEEFVEYNRKYIDKLPSLLSDAFWGHRVKLRFLKFALQYDKVTLPLIKRKGRARAVVAQVTSPAFRFDEASLAQFDQLEALLKQIRVNRLGHLETIKNDGFYVGLAPDGSLVAPGSGLSNPVLLKQLAVLTLVGLKTAISLAARRR
jgi:hypothetical protein